MNEELEAAAARYPNLDVADWNAVVATYPGLVGPDGVHLTAAGQAAMAKVIADHVAASVTSTTTTSSTTSSTTTTTRARRLARRRPRHAPRARASSPRAMTRRWISLVPSPMIMSGASRK
jgi:hypothetical protein